MTHKERKYYLSAGLAIILGIAIMVLRKLVFND
jgi:hypothetical protein